MGMIAVSSASVIDGIFVGQFAGAEALAAVNLTIPLITLISGIILMLSIGSGVVCGKYLGEKNDLAAAETFTKTGIIIGAFCVLSRSLGLPVLFILSLSALIGDVGIFIARPLAEFATLFLSLAFFFRNRPQKVLAAAG